MIRTETSSAVAAWPIANICVNVRQYSWAGPGMESPLILPPRTDKKAVSLSGSKKWLVLGSLILIATIAGFLILRTYPQARIWRVGYFPFPPYMLEKPGGGPDGFVIQLVE